MQAFAPADYHPFDASNEACAPVNQQGPPLDGTKYASNGSSRSPGAPGAELDTFSCTSVQQTISEVTHQPRKNPPVVPGPGAQRIDLLEYIKQQLDCFGTEPLLMNRYQLLGPDHRATGGVSCCTQKTNTA
jgi:hypothetical protein